jgi:hypothetical protein
MPVIKATELDAQMRQKLDAKAIADARAGGTQGAMQSHFLPQGEVVEQQAGHGQRGTAVYAGDELPQRGFFGSSTVISVNDAPPLDAGLEPKPVPVPPAPSLAPAPADAAPQGKPSAADILRQFGLAPKA